MSRHINGEPHTPEKITFQYLKYSVSDMSKQVARRKGDRYKISPFQLLINDGNYYLLAFDDYSKKMRTYRVDRMRDIRFTGEPRDGDEEFKQIDLKTYTKRVLSNLPSSFRRSSSVRNTFACRLFFSWRIFLMGFFLITKSLSSQLKNTRRLRM